MLIRYEKSPHHLVTTKTLPFSDRAWVCLQEDTYTLKVWSVPAKKGLSERDQVSSLQNESADVSRVCLQFADCLKSRMSLGARNVQSAKCVVCSWSTLTFALLPFDLALSSPWPFASSFHVCLLNLPSLNCGHSSVTKQQSCDFDWTLESTWIFAFCKRCLTKGDHSTVSETFSHYFVCCSWPTKHQVT